MTLTDPLGDMITRIRNAQMRHKETVSFNKSRLLMNVLEVMKQEGFIGSYTVHNISKGIEELTVKLRYYEGEPVIKEIKRISRPGRRVYASKKNMPIVYNGLGVTILSTSKGVISSAKAMEQSVGGEVLCNIF